MKTIKIITLGLTIIYKTVCAQEKFIGGSEIVETMAICNWEAKEYLLLKPNEKNVKVKSLIYNINGVLGFIEAIKDNTEFSYNFYPLNTCGSQCSNWVEIPKNFSEEEKQKMIKKAQKKAPSPEIIPELIYKLQRVADEPGEKSHSVVVSNFEEFKVFGTDSSSILKIDHLLLKNLSYIELNKKERFTFLYINPNKDSLVAKGSKLSVLLLPEKDKSGKNTEFLCDNLKKSIIFSNENDVYEFILDTINSDTELIKSDSLFQIIFNEEYLKKLGDIGEVIRVDKQYLKIIKKLIDKEKVIKIK